LLQNSLSPHYEGNTIRYNTIFIKYENTPVDTAATELQVHLE